MRVIFKSGLLALSCENEAEQKALSAWSETSRDHVFVIRRAPSAKGAALIDLGLKADACREPINILFEVGDPMWWPISNLAKTPFSLRGRSYESVEGFWQGLNFERSEDRHRVAQLWGVPAKRAHPGVSPSETFVYDDRTYIRGAASHRGLMKEACHAKFSQDAAAAGALLATRERALTHRTRFDSETIPGALMADIWMRLRTQLQQLRVSGAGGQAPSETDRRILYFARDRHDFDFLSHFYLAAICMDGEMWATVEHFYQAQKSLDPAYRAAIKAAATPGIAKRMAARIGFERNGAHRSWFTEYACEPRPDWTEIKLDLMRRADWAKFAQYEELRKRLLATGTAELIEDNPHDAFWGTGPDGTGMNWAGKVLMEIREKIRQSASASMTMEGSRSV